MSSPKVSIIIPVYNVEKYIERCVGSLTAQTLKDIEIILVDDSSTDNSLKICNDLAAKDPRIKVITKVNQGAGMARNAALKIAEGEYIGFVDSDDFTEPDMFETLYNKAKQHESDLVMSGVKFVDGNMFSENGECVIKNYFTTDTQFQTAAELKELKFGIIGALPGDADDSKYGMSIWKNLFRHEIIKQNGLVFQNEREMLSEDALFMVDFISHIKKATGINGAFYNYQRNAASISKSYKKDRLEKSLVFAAEAEKRFEKDATPNEYQIYLYRFWQAMCRVICSQEIMYAKENGVKYSALKNRLKAVCSHRLTQKAFKIYPIGTLPLKQRIFAYCIKYKMYFLQKVLVAVRSK